MTHEHDWVGHYRADGTLTGYVCKQCDAYREPTAMELSTKNQTSSSGRWWGKSTIYGKEDEHATPYMTRYWIGRLRLHIFHRGDQDPDCHDHPWDFWTFPLTPYVEEVAIARRETYDPTGPIPTPRRDLVLKIVPAWRPTFRPATHCHRVLGRYSGKYSNDRFGYGREYGPCYDSRPVITFVWRSKEKRDWGFLKNRDGKWCWVHWKAYVFGGGKNAPCE